MIQWDLWQYRNKVLHSPASYIDIASHYTLNHQIRKEKGIDSIAKTNSHMFSVHNSITNLQSSDISSKINWLGMVHLAQAEYEEPDTTIIRQSFPQHTQMQEF